MYIQREIERACARPSARARERERERESECLFREGTRATWLLAVLTHMQQSLKA
jgi:hypothetical protein